VTDPPPPKRKPFYAARIVGFILASPFVFWGVVVITTGAGWLRSWEGLPAYIEGFLALAIAAFLVNQTFKNS
jgi:hypothetical protein